MCNESDFIQLTSPPQLYHHTRTLAAPGVSLQMETVYSVHGTRGIRRRAEPVTHGFPKSPSSHDAATPMPSPY